MTGTAASRPSGLSGASVVSFAPESASALFRTTTKGISRERSRAAAAASVRPQIRPSVTSRATSARRMISRLRSARNLPNSPSSSRPAVSRKTTGPSGAISSVFSTGSVVVPGVSETMDTGCPARALSNEDLPALRRPKSAMCRRRPLGASVMGGLLAKRGRLRGGAATGKIGTAGAIGQNRAGRGLGGAVRISPWAEEPGAYSYG